MRLCIIALCCSFVVINFWIVANAATYAPFVRSRYSLRWRKTTTVQPRTHASPTTSGTPRELTTTEILNSVAEKDSTTNLIQPTTTKIAATTVATQPIMTTEYNGNEMPSSSTLASLKQMTTKLPRLRHQQPATESTTMHPKEKHLHNLAEYDYYDNGDIEEADEKQQT